MLHKQRQALAALGAIAVLSTAGCGASSDAATGPKPSLTPHTMTPNSSTPKSSSSRSGMAGMLMITINNFMYDGPTTAKPGELVMVTNGDGETHTLTSDRAGVFSVTVSGGGGTATFRAPTKPGHYAYHCDFHADMHGHLDVG